MQPGNKYAFDDMGIGKLLKDGRLAVPPNQRSYAWEERHVQDLLQDLNNAISKEGDEYFLGAIVLIVSDATPPKIADGQQRLATTTIILCHIRNRLIALGRVPAAGSIDADFIQKVDRASEEKIPILSLNLEDNEFFAKNIIAPPEEVVETPLDHLRVSNKRLLKAVEVIEAFFDEYLNTFPETSRGDQLIRWVDFIEHRANVIAVRVTDELGAYRIFETLNDRGLRAGQADLLKNFLLSKASRERLSEAQNLWVGVGSILEALGDDDSDLLVTYIRHLWITTHGTTKERELAEKIKAEIGGSDASLTFLNDAHSACQDYIALWSRSHPKWSDYKPSTKQYVETIYQHLQVEQIRPLMFAVARYFDAEEADKAFRLFVSWSVRFLIYGGRGGMLDTQYSKRAQEIGTGQVTKARELREAMSQYVPTDKEFEQSFAVARVSRPRLARYYLRSLEKTERQIPKPEYVANEEATEVNLEHVMPLNTGAHWSIDPETAKAVQRRLGNMVLLSSSVNADIGDSSFQDKKHAYSDSDYKLTEDVGSYTNWTENEIDRRQMKLAKLAVKTWPLSFD